MFAHARRRHLRESDGVAQQARAATVGLSHNSAAAVCAADDSTRPESRFSPNEASRSESEFSLSRGSDDDDDDEERRPAERPASNPSAPIRASCTAAADAKRRMARVASARSRSTYAPRDAAVGSTRAENDGDLSLGAESTE